MYGIMPVIINVGAQYGVSSITVAGIFVVGHCMAAGLCLTNPTVYLGLGLMGIDYREAFKANFKWSILVGTSMALLTLFIVR
jgi:Mg2+/citrate symporter